MNYNYKKYLEFLNERLEKSSTSPSRSSYSIAKNYFKTLFHIFEVDDKVSYQGYPNGPIEIGVVSSIKWEYNKQKVWVRFRGPNGQLTSVEKLKRI